MTAVELGGCAYIYMYYILSGCTIFFRQLLATIFGVFCPRSYHPLKSLEPHSKLLEIRLGMFLQ